MSRLVTTGAEWNDILMEAPNASGLASFFAGTFVFSTANPRSGSRNYRITASAVGTITFTAAASTTLYGRSYIYVSALPSAFIGICGFEIPSGNFYGIQLQSDGTLRLVNRAGTQIGSSSIAISAGSYNMLEVSFFNSVAGGTPVLEARLNGVSFASGSAGITASAVTGPFRFAASDGVVTVDADDIAVNDSSGTQQNSFPGSGKIVLLLPISDNAVGTGWTLGTGTVISANSGSTAVKNTPPLGVADLTAGSDTKQIRNATSNANVNYDANLTSYATAGIAAIDFINVLIPTIATAAPVTTSAKAGTVGIVSNPTISNIALASGGTAGAFWQGNAAGTYSAGWKISNGTLTYSPTVVLGTSPVMRITQVSSSTRIAMVSAMGMTVDYTPGGLWYLYPPLRPDRFKMTQAVKRGAFYMLGNLWRPEPKRVIMPREGLLVAA